MTTATAQPTKTSPLVTFRDREFRLVEFPLPKMLGGGVGKSLVPIENCTPDGEPLRGLPELSYAIVVGGFVYRHAKRIGSESDIEVVEVVQ